MDPIHRLYIARQDLRYWQDCLRGVRTHLQLRGQRKLVRLYEQRVCEQLDKVMTAQIYAHRHLTNALNPWPEKVIVITQEK